MVKDKFSGDFKRDTLHRMTVRRYPVREVSGIAETAPHGRKAFSVKRLNGQVKITHQLIALARSDKTDSGRAYFAGLHEQETRNLCKILEKL